MTFFDSLLFDLDEGVTGFFRQWNAYSTLMATALVGLVTYQIWARQDPDTHPLLLARQAQASPVRQPGESPVYRSQATPHGMPLASGLQVKDPGAARWARGRDGDLRDIWRQVVSGVQASSKAPPTAHDGAKGTRGHIFTVLGTAKITEHAVDDITRQINLIGRDIVAHGGSRVAIYLPNSVELLATLFACAFYDLTAIILPFDLTERALGVMLSTSAADTVVTEPGAFPFHAVENSNLRQLIWVLDEGNSHMDWDEVPKTTASAMAVNTWDEIVRNHSAAADADALLPVQDQKPETRDIVTFWQADADYDCRTPEPEMVCFTAANLVAAVAGQLLALPPSQRITHADLFLPADSLANTHTLALTLAALYSNASVAFNSVAAQAADLETATCPYINPTIVAVTPQALLQTHREAAAATSGVAGILHGFKVRSLAGNGAMPPRAATSASGPGKRHLRLIFTAERAGADATDPGAPKLTPAILTDLRVRTGAHIVYALTAARVAGAVAQTGVFDYRVFANVDEPFGSHFGAPLPSVEVLLRDTPQHKTTDQESRGVIVARGPCVAGEEASLGVLGVIRDDHTLAYLDRT